MILFVPHGHKLHLVSVAWNDWDREYYYCPLDGMLVNCKIIYSPSTCMSDTYLYIWVERQCGTGFVLGSKWLWWHTCSLVLNQQTWRWQSSTLITTSPPCHLFCSVLFCLSKSWYTAALRSVIPFIPTLTEFFFGFNQLVEGISPLY